MIKLIEEMLIYLRTANETERLSGARKRIDKVGFKVILLNITDWLKLEHKRIVLWNTFSKPMKLNYEYDWCLVLKELVETDEYFNNVFSIKGTELYYNELINEEARIKARRVAFEGHNPRAIR